MWRFGSFCCCNTQYSALSIERFLIVDSELGSVLGDENMSWFQVQSRKAAILTESTVPQIPWPGGDLTLKPYGIRMIAMTAADIATADSYGGADIIRPFPLARYLVQPGDFHDSADVLYDQSPHFVLHNTTASSWWTPQKVSAFDVTFTAFTFVGAFNVWNYTLTVRAVRPLINGSPAGPIHTVNTDVTAETVYVGVNNGVAAIGAVPLNAGTTISHGDVIGLDVWIQITRPSIVAGQPSPQMRLSYLARTRTFNTQLTALTSYIAGDGSPDFSATTHTYQLDFGGGWAGWTPTSATTWKIEDGSGYTVDINPGSIVATGPVMTQRDVHLTWLGERPVLRFDNVPVSSSAPPGFALAIYRSYYQPDPDGLYPHTDPTSAINAQTGVWHQSGTTTFRHFATTYQNSSGDPAYSQSRAVTGLTLEDLPDTITVTRVAQ